MNEGPADPVISELYPQLMRLAYRMLGSVSDAEDVVQNAWIRWQTTDRTAVREPIAFMRTIVTRLCLNELKSARRRRETYVGPWLPEPIFDPEDADAADDVTLPLMVVLERLTPLERASFLLHDIFGMEFDAVAAAIGREAATCRKLASRARAHIQAARPRVALGKEEGLRLAEAFFTASRTGDIAALRTMLAADIVLYADSGGKVPTLQRPSIGLPDVLQLHERLARIFHVHPSQLIRYLTIDGLPGFITIEQRDVVQSTALQIDGRKIIGIYVTRNQEKLKHVRTIAIH